MSLYIYSIGALGLLLVALLAASISPGISDITLVVAPDPGAWLLLLTLALFATIGGLYAYTAALRHLEAGVASILATFESVVAATSAYFVVGESVGWPQAPGGLLIILGVLILQIQPRKKF